MEPTHEQVLLDHIFNYHTQLVFINRRVRAAISSPDDTVVHANPIHHTCTGPEGHWSLAEMDEGLAVGQKVAEDETENGSSVMSW